MLTICMFVLFCWERNLKKKKKKNRQNDHIKRPIYTLVWSWAQRSTGEEPTGSKRCCSLFINTFKMGLKQFCRHYISFSITLFVCICVCQKVGCAHSYFFNIVKLSSPIRETMRIIHKKIQIYQSYFVSCLCFYICGGSQFPHQQSCEFPLHVFIS